MNTWFVSMYAEPGYAEKLKHRLSTLNRTLFFEDDVLHPVDNDNYFTYMVSTVVLSKAYVVLDTHRCSKGHGLSGYHPGFENAIVGHVDFVGETLEEDAVCEAGDYMQSPPPEWVSCTGQHAKG